MSYVERYRIITSNDKLERFDLVISEDGYAGGSTNLLGTVDALSVEYVNTDQDKYPEIRGSVLTTKFISQTNFNLEDLITDNDRQFKVDLYKITDVSGTPVTALQWSGYLNTDDCSEELVDDPKVIILKASDGLASLKKVDFPDVYDKITLLSCIEYCLAGTGINIDLHIEVNIFEDIMGDRANAQTNEPFSQCKVHTRSFTKDGNSFEDCYTVLQKILGGFTCTVFQQNGKWYIVRYHDRFVEDMTYGTVYEYPYTTDIPSYTRYAHRIQINDTSLRPVNVDHVKQFISPVGSSTTTYNYKVPFETPRNRNMTQGTFLSPLSSSTNTAFTISFWDLVNSIPEVSAVATPYRNSIFDGTNGNYLESYIVIPRDVPAVANGNRLRSEAIEVNAGDRVRISAETRTALFYDASLQIVNTFYVRLVGDSSTVYTLQERNVDGSEPARWNTGTGSVVQTQWPDSFDSTTWQRVDVNSDPFPEAGDLYIYFVGYDGFVLANETWYRDISMDIDLVNGVSKLIGETDSHTQEGNFKETSDFETFVSDAPKKIISGAIFELDGTTLTTTWHRQGHSEEKRLIELNDLARFQSRHRLMKRIAGSFKNITYEDPDNPDLKILIGPVNTFEIQYGNLVVVIFLTTNIRLDLIADIAYLNLIEFFDTTKDSGDPEGDTQTFNYIFE